VKDNPPRSISMGSTVIPGSPLANRVVIASRSAGGATIVPLLSGWSAAGMNSRRSSVSAAHASRAALR
jgi:hypothetical protein